MAMTGYPNAKLNEVSSERLDMARDGLPKSCMVVDYKDSFNIYNFLNY